MVQFATVAPLEPHTHKTSIRVGVVSLPKSPSATCHEQPEEEPCTNDPEKQGVDVADEQAKHNHDYAKYQQQHYQTLPTWVRQLDSQNDTHMDR
jgi:hypothetical protein